MRLKIPCRITFKLSGAVFPRPLERLGTPGMACNLWGVSPLYENEGLKEGSIPTVTPIDKILEIRNCVRATNRGEEARSQSCEVTDRNSIQGRFGLVSGPTTTKLSSFVGRGKSRACAAKVGRLIQGDLPNVPVSRACPKGGAVVEDCGRVWQKAAEGIRRVRHTPLAVERPEP